MASLCESLLSCILWARVVGTLNDSSTAQKIIVSSSVQEHLKIVESTKNAYNKSLTSFNELENEYSCLSRQPCSSDFTNPKDNFFAKSSINETFNEKTSLLRLKQNQMENYRINSAFTPVQGKIKSIYLHGEGNVQFNSPLKMISTKYINELQKTHSFSPTVCNNRFTFPSLSFYHHFVLASKNSQLLPSLFLAEKANFSEISPSTHSIEPLTDSLVPLMKTASPVVTNADSRADIEVMVSSLGRNKGNHICLYCGKKYSRKYGLKIHVRTHTGYKPLKCRVCHRPFGDPSNLNKHFRLHAQGDTPYRCELCGKVR